jgi:hypothetical protein
VTVLTSGVQLEYEPGYWLSCEVFLSFLKSFQADTGTVPYTDNRFLPHNLQFIIP